LLVSRVKDLTARRGIRAEGISEEEVLNDFKGGALTGANEWM
jgi:hypothetical protein